MFMKILIINGCSWYNKGDVSIRLCQVQSLREAFGPDVQIKLLSVTHDVDEKFYNEYGIQIIPLTIVPALNSSLIYKLSNAIQAFLSLSLSALAKRILNLGVGSMILNKRQQDMFNSYIEADLIISSGGGFISDNFPFSSLFPNLFQILLALILKKQVVTYPQSIGPFKKKIYKFLTRWILNRLDMILLREQISKKCLKEIGVKEPKIYVTTDIAFLLPTIDNLQAKKILLIEGIKRDNNPILGMTLVNWTFPGHRDKETIYNKYIYIMAKVADYFIEKLNGKVVIIPQVTDVRKNGDWVTTNEVFHAIQNKERVKIILGDYWPQELKGIIGQMDLFIGTRMHSNIFALSMSVPTLAISYEPKTDGIMNMLGLEKWVLPINNLTEDIFLKVEELWNQRESVRKHLLTRISMIQEKARYNAELIKEYWEEKCKGNVKSKPLNET